MVCQKNLAFIGWTGEPWAIIQLGKMVNWYGSKMTEKSDPAKEINKLEFDRRIELLTKLYVDAAKEAVKAKGNKKRHKQ